MNAAIVRSGKLGIRGWQGALAKGAVFGAFLLLGAWGHGANACSQAHAAPARAGAAHQSAVLDVSVNSARIGTAHRCECPGAAVRVQSVASESDRSLQLPDPDKSGGLPVFSSADLSRLLAARTEASFSAARALWRPRYLLTLRLRQ